MNTLVNIGSAQPSITGQFSVGRNSADVTSANKSSPSEGRAIPVSPAKPPFTPGRLLEDIVAGKAIGHDVAVVVEKGQVVIGQESLRFKVRSSKSGYVYVLMLDASHSNLTLLYPNASEKNNRIEAGQELTLPPPGWKFQAQGPAGTDQFVALVSEAPRDF